MSVDVSSAEGDCEPECVSAGRTAYRAQVCRGGMSTSAYIILYINTTLLSSLRCCKEGHSRSRIIWLVLLVVL